ncbi:DNA (cytosine-5-)-methyltransferase N-terminal subunit [Mycoplasmopsis arginini]|uniref:DNA (cytosine-5-)-methyltransferase N-terminal subunit n=2 Tax=Mycoplasmopsis arginini TaxID=2094 RepID=UPI003515DE51
MKKIRLFEMFSGIGSQYKALKNLEKKLNFKTISLGACDFYIDAIISYMIIHYGALEKEVKIPNEKQIEILSKNSYSSNSKSQVSRNYFSRISKEKLNTIFPYLNAFTNNDYFRNVYNFSNDSRERERERERERFI